MRENDYQADLIKRIQTRFEGCLILKNDPNYKRGIPDLTILYKDKWAALECKAHAKATHRPRQDSYIAKMDEMSFARFIYPENETEVLDELQQAFSS